MKMRTFLLAAAAIAVALALLWAFMPRPFPVEVVEVQRNHFEQTVDDDGRTRVRDRYIVSAPMPGRMERVELEPGDEVKRGQVVAVLHPLVPPLLDARTEGELRERVGAAEAILARASTAVERARAALANSKVDLARTQALAARAFVSKAQVERDELAVTLNAREVEALQFERHAAEHQLELARAALSRSRIGWNTGRGERLEIRSPVDGTVFRVLQKNEATVAPGAGLLELGDARALEVVVDLLSSDAVQVPLGAHVHLQHFGGGTLEGRVRRIEPSAFTKVSALGVEEQRVNIIIDLISPAALWQSLGDGYRVDARVVVFRAENVLTVPLGSMFRDGNNWAVFVVRGSIARRQMIEVSRRGATEALVSRGLEPGDRVILYPAERLRDGLRVRLLTLKTSD